MTDQKKLFIADLITGLNIDADFLVLAVSSGRTSRGGLYLNVELGDRTGRVQAKVWDEAESMAAHLPEGSAARVRGYVDSYRGALQLVIREALPLDPAETNWADFLRVSPRPPERMKAELWELVEGLADADYRRLVAAVLRDEEVADKFFFMPAAKSLHHAYLYGLLEHSLSVGRLARLTAGHYGPGLSGDLLVAGALLHDLGKIWEFSPPPRVDYTTRGRLTGHLVLGAEFVLKTAAAWPDFPAEKAELLRHLILSHHGEHEFGAPVKPQLLEAVVLHLLDNMDAKVEAVNSFLSEAAGENGWSGYHRLFGGYFMRTPPMSPRLTAAADGEPPEKPLHFQRDAEEEGQEAEAAESEKDGRLF
ncbi:MAG: HD domain-containing protein [Candidatus Adiutrix sp.]|jgi:3'-5' exoribonuclease|nr:HD domain-containing protein [Candidatus Adiutrix sp.]